MEDVGDGKDIDRVSIARPCLDRIDNSFGSRDATQILNSAVIPRPIAFVSTLSAENSPNLAPFRYGMRLVCATI